MNSKPFMVTVPEACKRTGLTKYMIRKMMEKKMFAFIQVGRKLYVNYDSLVECLSGSEVIADNAEH